MNDLDRRLKTIAPLQWFRVVGDREYPIAMKLGGGHHFKTRAQWCEIHAELTQILEHVVKPEAPVDSGSER